MNENLIKDIEAQLSSDTSGSFKKYILDKLREHKDNCKESKSRAIPPDEYEQIEHLEYALDAAISIIESKTAEGEHCYAFNNIF